MPGANAPPKTLKPSHSGGAPWAQDVDNISSFVQPKNGYGAGVPITQHRPKGFDSARVAKPPVPHHEPEAYYAPRQPSAGGNRQEAAAEASVDLGENMYEDEYDQV